MKADLKTILLYKPVALKLILVSLVFGVAACNSEGRTAKKLAQDTKLAQNIPAAKESESGLTVNDVILDRVDEQGRPLWKIKAKQAVYSNNKKIAKIDNPIGDLFQDGKLVYQVSGLEGEVREDGKQIFLKGQIVANDIQNGVVMRGNELEWRPQEDILIVRNQLTGSHKKVQASAREGRAFSRSKRIELIGQVAAKANDPPLQMRTEHLVWLVQEEKLFTDRPVEMERYSEKAITARGKGNRGEVDLKNKIAKLKQNGQITFLEPPLQIASDSIVWNLDAKTLVSDRPVSIQHRVQQMTLTASKGRVDLEPQIAYLVGGVQGAGQRPPSQLRTDRMTWFLPTQKFEAEGNVFYQQSDPPLTLNGPKAFGQLKEQTILISGGGNGSQVVTEIVPPPSNPPKN